MLAIMYEEVKKFHDAQNLYSLQRLGFTGLNVPCVYCAVM